MGSTFSRLGIGVILVLSMVLPAGLANATTYAAGVFVGERFTYGDYQSSWNTTGSPFSAFENVNTTTLLVTNVSSPVVAASVTFNFTDGSSPRTSVLRGDLSTGDGDLGIFIIAGGLVAGDNISSSASTPTINGTVSRLFAGFYRTANFYDGTLSDSSGSLHELLLWDRPAGVLLEAWFNESRSLPEPGQGYLHYILVGTSGWPSPQLPSTIFGLVPWLFYSIQLTSTLMSIKRGKVNTVEIYRIKGGLALTFDKLIGMLLACQATRSLGRAFTRSFI